MVGTGPNRFVPPPPDSEIELAAGRGGDDDLVRSPDYPRFQLCPGRFRRTPQALQAAS
jgi:hypothetical protein